MPSRCGCGSREAWPGSLKERRSAERPPEYPLGRQAEHAEARRAKQDVEHAEMLPAEHPRGNLRRA